MGNGRYVPWTKVGSWSCLACGECCRGFKITLTPYEYAKLSMNYGFRAVSIDEHGSPCVTKVGGRCIFLDPLGLCSLQPLGAKPLACRSWPFIIGRRAFPGCEDALFRYRGEDYYVYVDGSYPCPGMGRGHHEDLRSVISELIEMRGNPSRPQRYSTSVQRTYPRRR